MDKLVLEKFEDYLDYREAESIFEALEEYYYKFVADNQKCEGNKSGFYGLKDIQEFSDEGNFNKTEGWETGMKLMDWEKTEGYKNSEERVYKYAEDDLTVEALKEFKKKFPEKYVAAILFLTHGKYPKSASLMNSSRDERFSPLGKGGGNLFGKKKGKVTCLNKSVAEKIIKTDPKRAEGGNAKSLEFQIPEGAKTDGFFVINEWDLSDEFKEYLNKNFFDQIKSAVEQAKPLPGKPKAFLDNIKIETSCSTLPNKASKADGKTYSFKGLAEKRAQSTLDYVKTELKKLGVLIDDDTKIEINSDGTNKGKKVIKGYGNLTKGIDLTGTSGDEWDGKNTEEIKKNQKVGFSGNVMINTSNAKPPEEERTPGDVITIPGNDEFIVTATFGKRNLPKIEFPRIDIKLNLRGLFGKSKQYDCPKF
jgi:hypothetical protein